MRRGVTETLAPAALVGKHPVGTPEADALAGHEAVPQLAARPVCERDEGRHALDAPPVGIDGTVARDDAVRRVEAAGAVLARGADRPVCPRAQVAPPAGAADKDKPLFARQALARAARDTPVAKVMVARHAPPVLIRHKRVVTRDGAPVCLGCRVLKRSARAVL